MRNAWRTALLGLACLGAFGCERGPTVDSEVASELRALRMLLREDRPQAAAAAPEAAREAVDGALRPLRDVLTQLGTAQRELATRQTALTQEMQRWTQLVVGAMQDQRAEQGRDLQQRLEQLERTMAEQDVRHREVEGLLQGALDDTATHLEDFLRRLEKIAPGVAPPAAPGEDGGTTPPGPGDDGRPGAVDASGTPLPGAGGEQGATPGGTRQGASRWPWWVLAFAAVAIGVRLLLPRRPRPLAIAPEMQTKPATHAAGTATAAEATLDEPEVEELWAAAALLGEAIGKIRQSTDPVEMDRLLAGALPRSEPTAPELLEAERPEPDDFAAGLDLDDLFVLDEDEAPEQEREQEAEPVTATPLRPVRSAPARQPEPVVELPRPASSTTPEQRIGRPGPDSVSCRLTVRDAERAEARVRDLLGGDPRVLVQPAPEVRVAPGELCVVFALLPGLPAGERSQLEQRLRDAVA
ncbi:MAG: hypothetical protein H6835_13170 [Planctomycetes bacterium]|nr:hypothetical protein [Planctomycetota bacterium]